MKTCRICSALIDPQPDLLAALFGETATFTPDTCPECFEESARQREATRVSAQDEVNAAANEMDATW